MAAVEQVISDEEFARQLQQEEFGSLLPGSYFGSTRNQPTTNQSSNNPSSNNSQDMGAPLLDDNNNQNINIPNPLLNPNIVNNNNNANNIPNNNNNNNNNNNINQNIGNAAQRARRNVIGSVRDADTDSPRILLLRIVIGLIEIIATSTILAIGWNETSDAESECKLLKYWVLVYTARHFITIPLRIHIYQVHRRAAIGGNNNDARIASEKSIQLLRWVSILTFLWFLVGQTFLFTGKSCEDAAPTIWYYCLVIIILVYVSLALPFLIVLAICICLPCVLIIFRFFAEPEGADDRIIKDLPTRKIIASDLHKTSTNTDDKEEKDNNTNDTNDTNDNNNNEEDDENDSEAPSCAICMQDYKIDDELRILPCKHEFHTECVDKWLPMKKICPLCRHDITKPVTTNNNNTTSSNNNNNNNNSNSNNNANNANNNDPLPSYQSLIPSGNNSVNNNADNIV